MQRTWCWNYWWTLISIIPVPGSTNKVLFQVLPHQKKFYRPLFSTFRIQVACNTHHHFIGIAGIDQYPADVLRILQAHIFPSFSIIGTLQQSNPGIEDRGGVSPAYLPKWYDFPVHCQGPNILCRVAIEHWLQNWSHCWKCTNPTTGITYIKSAGFCGLTAKSTTCPLMMEGPILRNGWFLTKEFIIVLCWSQLRPHQRMWRVAVLKCSG